MPNKYTNPVISRIILSMIATSQRSSLKRDSVEQPLYTVWLKKAYTRKNGKEKGFEQYLDELKSEFHNTLQEKLAQNMVNEPAPLFTLHNMDGKEVSLASLKGKVVVLDRKSYVNI